MQPAEIRLLSSSESPELFTEIARLHAEEISEGFLTSLGVPLLSRLYRAIACSPHAFILVAGGDGHIVGFLCGSTDTGEVYRHVLTRSWPHILPKLAGRVFRWTTVKRLWETIRYPSRTPSPDLPSAEILNFCVTGRLQRSGVGRRLFAVMESEFSRRGVREIRIVTGAQQLSAIHFYEKIGAEPAGSIEVHSQSESRLFRYSIKEARPPEPGSVPSRPNDKTLY